MVAVVLLVAAGCSTTPDGDVDDARSPLAETVSCDRRYGAIGPTGGGNSINNIEIRAETSTDLRPDQLEQVTAVACDLSTIPEAPCPQGFTCAQRPRPLCQQVPVAINDAGELSALCGTRTEERDGANTLTRETEHVFSAVTFYVR
jgi:hypothetical protein